MKMKATHTYKRGGIYYWRRMVKGKLHTQSLDTGEKAAAIAKARALDLALVKEEWDKIFAARLRGPGESDTTVGKVLELYEKNARSLELEDHTARTCRNCLRLVIRRGLPSSKPDDVKVVALTGKLVRGYKAAMLEAFDDEDEQRQQQVKRSTNSILRQARAVFKPAALQLYKDNGLELPDLREFKEEPDFPKCGKDDYRPPSDEILAKTFGAIERLAHGGPIHRNMHRALCLAVGAGLRKSEIAEARWNWFTQVDGQPMLRSSYITKNGSNMDTPIVGEWYRKLQATRPQQANADDLVLQGCATERRETTFRRISRMMRGLGWETEKCVHEFRAFVGCKVAEKHGIEAASLFLRHGAISTTQKYYGRYLKLRTVDVKIGG
jgi:integrase